MTEYVIRMCVECLKKILFRENFGVWRYREKGETAHPTNYCDI